MLRSGRYRGVAIVTILWEQEDLGCNIHYNVKEEASLFHLTCCN